MALTLTGEETTTLSGTSYRAKDSHGNQVTVQASDEALQDYGMAAIEQKAAEKYDAGSYTQSGNVRVVTVHTTDF